MNIQDQLRVENRKVQNAVPLMAQAADEIDRLQAELKPKDERIAELEEALRRAYGILDSVLRLG